MQDIIYFLLLGLGIGALYATLGAGLVIVYKGSGVINFAHGALAMYGVFTFDTAWNRGQLFLPWVDIVPTHSLNLPVRITLSDSGHVHGLIAFFIAVAMAALLGFAAHFLVFRPLRNAAPLGKVVASLGLALYLQGVALVNFGNSFPVPRSVFPDGNIKNFLGLGRPYPTNTLWALAFAILMGAGLWAVYRYTRFGLATRAAAGNEKGAILLGYSPQFLAAVNWVGASVLATIAAIVVGPLQGAITPVGLTALIVPALAAALIGSLRSVPIAVGGGLALGSVTTLLSIKKTTWFDERPLLWIQDGITQSVPLLVIVAVLFLRGNSLPIRGTVEERRLPLSPAPQRMYGHAVVWITAVTLLAFIFEGAGPRSIFAGALQNALVFGIIMLSMVVLTGYVGQISLAQMSMAGVAAFFMARMMANGDPSGSNLVPVPGPDFPWPIAAGLGIVAAVVVGIILGLPALRIRGVQLAVVTIAAAIAIQSLYLENDEVTKLRAGVPAFIPTPTFFGANIGARSARAQNENPNYAIFAVVVLALLAIAISNLRRTGTGRRFLAVRANERAAASAGINVARTKLLAFGLAAGIAGIGGVMLAFRQVEVSSANFPYQASLAILAFAYLGGITSINGGIVGGLLVAGSVVPVGSNYFFAETNIDRYVTLVGGLGLIVTAIVHPAGLAPFFQGLARGGGNWLVSAVPGATTIRKAFHGPRKPIVGTALTAGVVGFAFWIYNAQFVDSNLLWVLISIGLLWLISVGIARALGPLEPSFVDAGKIWGASLRRHGPVLLIGYILGWLVWPIRVDTYSKLWMPLLGAYLAIFIWSIVTQIRNARRAGADPPTPTDSTRPTLAEVG